MIDWKTAGKTLLAFFFQKFYNKITWFIVISGVTMMSSPLWEQLIEAILISQFNIQLQAGISPAFGLGLIIVGLAYNSMCQWLDRRSSTQAQVFNSGPTPAQKHDSELFSQFLNLLPVSHVVSLARDHDFGVSFDIERMNPFYQFVEVWDNAEHEFQDERIEKGKQILRVLGISFAQLVTYKTYPLTRSRFNRVFPDGSSYEEHQIGLKNAEEINDAATAFYEHYDKFVRETKRALLTASTSA